MKFVPRNGRAHDMAFSVGWFHFTDSSKRHMPLKNPSKAAQSVNWAKSSIRFLLGKHTHCNNVYSQSTVLGYNFLNIIDALEVFLRLHKAVLLSPKILEVTSGTIKFDPIFGGSNLMQMDGYFSGISRKKKCIGYGLVILLMEEILLSCTTWDV